MEFKMTDKELFEEWFLNYPSWLVIMSRQEACQKAWEAACEIKNKKIKELEEKLNVAREALEFYGDGGNWFGVEDYNGDYVSGKINERDIVYDSTFNGQGGKRAIEALEKIGKNTEI